MTRKDYELIAKIMRDTRPTADSGDHYHNVGTMDEWLYVIETAVLAFHADNPKFQPDRFRKACYGGA